MNKHPPKIPPEGFQNSRDTSYSGEAELWAIEKSLTKYNRDLVSKLSDYFKSCVRVLDFGAGVGTLATLWAKATGIAPECLEIDQNLNKVVQARGFVCYDNLGVIGGVFDGIYTSNVLEHIEEDQVILGQLFGKLKQGGVIAIYVPAFMCLYSSMDIAVGHYRRYSSNDLCGKLQSVGFKVLSLRYSDSLGFFIWWYLKLRGAKSQNQLSNFRMLAIYDKFIYPISRFFDEIGFKYFLGKNLLVVAEK